MCKIFRSESQNCEILKQLYCSFLYIPHVVMYHYHRLLLGLQNKLHATEANTGQRRTRTGVFGKMNCPAASVQPLTIIIARADPAKKYRGA